MYTEPSRHPDPPTARHGPNPSGARDLVIGDLHGEFNTLIHALEALEFRPDADRLFSVGDLIDRGAKSADALQWLETGRFAGSVRGNHEQMMVDALVESQGLTVRKSGPGATWMSNGADWWYGSPKVAEAHEKEHDWRTPWPHAERWLRALATMPYLATIEYDSRRVGLVHAPGATDGYASWNELCNEYVDYDTSPDHRPGMAEVLWWEPTAWGETAEDGSLKAPIADVDLVLAGHCPGPAPAWARRNVVCIDTGVHFDTGHLTVAEIQDGLVLNRFARRDPAGGSES